VSVVVTEQANRELFEGDVTLSLDIFTDPSGSGLAVVFEPLNVSVTYSTDGHKLRVEGAGGAMELGTMPVSGVEVTIDISGGVFSGTLEGKVVMEQGDYLKYAGVPELNFNSLSAAVELEAAAADGVHLFAKAATLVGKVLHSIPFQLSLVTLNPVSALHVTLKALI
jgi:hypothetical protein